MDIKSAKFVISSPSVTLCPKPDMPEYAFIGRSNVGKSSLINMLVNQPSLAKTSQTPGKTQLINHFIINDSFYFVDLPGYGFAKRSLAQRASWEKMIKEYIKQRSNLVTVFVLIDSRLEPQNNDLMFIKNLGEWEVPFNIVFTKADKTSQREVSKHVKMFIEALRKEWEFIPQSFQTSAVKHHGRKAMLEFIGNLNDTIKESQKTLLH